MEELIAGATAPGEDLQGLQLAVDRDGAKSWSQTMPGVATTLKLSDTLNEDYLPKRKTMLSPP